MRAILGEWVRERPILSGRRKGSGTLFARIVWGGLIVAPGLPDGNAGVADSTERVIRGRLPFCSFEERCSELAEEMFQDSEICD